MRLRTVLAAAAILAASLTSKAESITYTTSAYLSGSIGTSTFSNALTTFSLTADTSSLTGIPGLFSFNTGGISTVTIAGIGTATVLSNTYGAVAQNFGSFGAAGFYDPSTAFAVAPSSAALIGYDLATALAPVTGATVINGAFAEPTSLGNLIITTSNVSVPGTFSAVPSAIGATPEPSSIALLGTSVLGFAGVLRRRCA